MVDLMVKKLLTGMGECMIELSNAGEGLMKKSFAGDVVNTLWYARKALPVTWSTSFFTGLGEDKDSADMISFLESAGIECAGILRIPDRNPGLYMIDLDQGERSFSYWRDTSAAKLLASDPGRLEQVIDSADALYVSGITMAILSEDHRDRLIGALGEARKAGKEVVFDSNIRPRLWENGDVMRQVLSRTAEVSSLVFPSFDDEAAVFGDRDVEATGARYGSNGALVVVKDGGRAVLTFQDGASQLFETELVSAPVDTTGAGDSFNGAFLGDYLVSGDVAASVRAGQTCAAHVIGHHGALV